MMWWAVWTAAAGTVLLFLYRSSQRLGGKLVVLTGADSGVGYDTARVLAARGARVIIACEDPERGSSAAEILRNDTGADVQYRNLNLASLNSVREFASYLSDNEAKLDILINNASVAQLDNTLTENGIVVEMQINYFGPYLLTNLLLPMLARSSQGRIVCSTSVMHYLGNINLESLGEKARDSHTHKRMLATSKLCNILFTRELARRLQDTRVTVNCFHPGAVDNQVVSPGSFQLLLRPLFRLLSPGGALGEAGGTCAYVAASPALARVTGKYFVDCTETEPSKVARDEELGRRLWAVSEQLVQLKNTMEH